MLPWIDALRGLAILMVLANHVALQVPGLSAPVRALASFGQMGVQLFFVASAYTLCLSWQQRRAGEGRPLLAFLLRRVFRIAPLYWFAIALFAGLHFLNVDADSGGTDSPYTAANVWANLGFVHGLLPAAQNSVVPGGWSIGVEMFFYLLFPLLLRAAQSVRASVLLASLALALNLLWQTSMGGVANNSAAYFHPLNQMPVFLLGMALFRWQQEARRTARLTARLTAQPPALLFVSAIAAALLALLATAFLWRSGWALAFALVPVSAGLGFAALAQAASLESRFPAALLAFGRASYPVYIIHILFAWHGLHALQQHLPLSGDLGFAFALLAVSALSYAAARCLARCIERPGIAAGAWLIRHLSGPAAASSTPALVASKGSK